MVGTAARRHADGRKAGTSGYVFPMSFAQQRLWFLDEIAPGNPFYNIPLVLPFPGRLDRRILARAINEIVRRHEALRTRFRLVDGEPSQIVAPSLTIPVGNVTLEDVPQEARDAHLQRLATDEARRIFDLRRGPLLRVTVVTLGRANHVILVTLHHIVADGWSVGVFVRELSTLYAGVRRRAARRRCRSCRCSMPTSPSGSASGSEGERLDDAARLLAQRSSGAPAGARAADRPAAPSGADYQGAA